MTIIFALLFMMLAAQPSKCCITARLPSCHCRKKARKNFHVNDEATSFTVQAQNAVAALQALLNCAPAAARTLRPITLIVVSSGAQHEGAQDGSFNLLSHLLFP